MLNDDQIRELKDVQFVYAYPNGVVRIARVIEAEPGVGLTAVNMADPTDNLICVNMIEHPELHTNEVLQMIAKAIISGTYRAGKELPEETYEKLRCGCTISHISACVFK